MQNKKYLYPLLAIFFFFLLGFAGWLWWDPFHQVKQAKITPIPSAAPAFTLAKEKYPRWQLDFLGDEHHLRLQLNEIPAIIKSGEYDFTYFSHNSAGEEFEKGLYDSFTVTGGEVEKTILLGTSSCTTGTCRYHYDQNVSRGEINFTFFDDRHRALTIKRAFWFLHPGAKIKIKDRLLKNSGRAVCLLEQMLRPPVGKENVLRFSCLPGGQLLSKNSFLWQDGHWQKPSQGRLTRGILGWSK